MTIDENTFRTDYAVTVGLHLLYLVSLLPVYTSTDENIHRNKGCEALRNLSSYAFAVSDLNFPII